MDFGHLYDFADISFVSLADINFPLAGSGSEIEQVFQITKENNYLGKKYSRERLQCPLPSEYFLHWYPSADNQWHST